MPQKPRSFPHQAAKLSWVCPIIVFVLGAFATHSPARLIIELVALLLMIVGFVSGIVALFGVPRHGRNGILAPAVVGIVINALLLFIFVDNFMAARAAAQRQRGDVPSPTVVAYRK